MGAPQAPASTSQSPLGRRPAKGFVVLRRREHSDAVEPVRRRYRTTILVVGYLSALVVMWTLKRYYSTAGAEALRWILQPVAGLVAGLGGSDYAWEAGIGYVRSDYRFTIAPACAGINFMLMVYGLTVAAFLHRCRSCTGRMIFPADALAGAYVLTLLVNTLRILLSVRLYELEAAWGWLTPGRLHRLAGVAVYFSALGLYYAVLKRIMAWESDRFRLGPGASALVPLGWYIAGAVAVPAANRLLHGRGLPAPEHWITVVAASAGLWGIGLAARALLKRFCT
jgi:exosortase K